uniref:Odorant receptor n=1 Tax=Aulacocentrum confusum TaxID=2767324 RepID=A0A7G8Z966_9HYME|nr:olfactory receptor 47 [Aulacocentrum confusum]
MKVLTENFRILQYCGVWLPVKWTGNFKEKCYHFYTIIIVLLYSSFCVSCVIGFLMSMDDIEKLVNSGVMMLTFITSFVKMMNLLIKRNDMLQIFGYMDGRLCRPQNTVEKSIQLNSTDRARSILKFYGSMVMGAVITITIGSLFEDVPTRNLPFNGYLPYYHSENFGYWIFAFLYQHFGHFCCAAIGCVSDTVVYGTLIQICSQLKILKYRFRNYMSEKLKKSEISSVMIEEQNFFDDSLEHHLIILQISSEVNDIFSFTIFTQFLLSSVILTVTIKTLSSLSLMSSKFASIVSYLSCMLGQIFFFCWYGNEVSLESSGITSAVYEGDWLTYSLKTRKNLLIFMARTIYPIVFTSGHIVTLTVASFNSLIKMSYSAYNVLSQVA